MSRTVVRPAAQLALIRRLSGAYRNGPRPVVGVGIDYHFDRGDHFWIATPPIQSDLPSDLGDDVARAKRTDKAEARRKYRAYLQAQEEAELASAQDSDETAAEAATAAAKPGRGRAGSPAPVTQPGVRMGMFAAARAAYRPTNYLDDLRSIRSLTFGSKAVWAPLLLCLGAGAYVFVQRNSSGTDPLWLLIVQFVFYPVPLAPPMLAGFLAPKSTWLAGLIAAFFASTTLVVVILMTTLQLSTFTTSATSSGSPLPSGAVASGSPGASAQVTATLSTGSPAASASAGTSTASPAPSPSAAGASTGSTGSGSGRDPIADEIQLLSVSLAFGALMGALTGWYKRFLTLTSGTTKKPTPRSGGGRPAQRRSAAKGARR